MFGNSHHRSNVPKATISLKLMINELLVSNSHGDIFKKFLIKYDIVRLKLNSKNAYFSIHDKYALF